MAKKNSNNNGNNKKSTNMELLEEHQFTFRGKDVHLSISAPTDPNTVPPEPYIFKAFFTEKGLQEELIFKCMPADFIAVAAQCEYFVQRVNKGNNDKVENTRGNSFYVTPQEFYGFFMSPTGTVPMGIFLGRNFLNGMTFEEKRTLGVRFFNTQLQPAQPVTYDVETTPPTEGQEDGIIEITAIDGVAPFTYSVDGVDHGTDNVIEGLASGEHVVRVTDSAGTYWEQTETV